MSRLDALPPDQRAALSLLAGPAQELRRDRLAARHPGARGARPRARRARMLAQRQARELSAERARAGGRVPARAGGPPAQRPRRRACLESSTPARAWAQALAAELAPLATPLRVRAGDAEPRRAARPRSRGAGAAADAPAPSSPGEAPIARSAGSAADLIVGGRADLDLGGAPARPRPSPSSDTERPGGLDPRGHQHRPLRRAPSIDLHVGQIRQGPADPALTQRLHAHLPRPRRQGAWDIVEVVSEGTKRAFFVDAENLRRLKGFRYARGCTTRPPTPASRLRPAGRAPTVASRRRGGCPPTPRSYDTILLTERTAERPRQPGPSCSAGRSSAWRLAKTVAPGFGRPASVRQQLPRVHDPRGVQLRLQRTQRRHALLADLAHHPGDVVAPDGMVVGDRAPVQRDRVARRAA